MTLKQATLLAIIAVILNIAISLGYVFQVEFYKVLSALNILSYIGLLPFFIIIYQRQKDEN